MGSRGGSTFKSFGTTTIESSGGIDSVGSGGRASSSTPWPRVAPWIYAEFGPMLTGANCMCTGPSLILWGAKVAAILSLFFDRVISTYGGIEPLEIAPPESSYAHRLSLSVASMLGLAFFALQRLILRVMLAWITVTLVNRSIERQMQEVQSRARERAAKDKMRATNHVQKRVVRYFAEQLRPPT